MSQARWLIVGPVLFARSWRPMPCQLFTRDTSFGVVRGEVDQAVEFVRNLEKNDELEALLTRKIADVAAESDDDDVFESVWRGVSGETVSRAKEIVARKVPKKSIRESLELMTQRDGWNRRDIKYLANVSSRLRGADDHFVAGFEQGVDEGFGGAAGGGGNLCQSSP